MHIALEKQSLWIDMTCLVHTEGIIERVGTTKWCATGAQEKRWHEKEEHFECTFLALIEGMSMKSCCQVVTEHCWRSQTLRG